MKKLKSKYVSVKYAVSSFEQFEAVLTAKTAPIVSWEFVDNKLDAASRRVMRKRKRPAKKSVKK